jgi:superfamily II DNA or RNA helicase
MGTPVSSISLPTGSGKTWIIALVAYFKGSPSLVVVATRQLKAQMQVLFDKLGFLNIEVITRADYYNNPSKYTQENVFIDEYDESVIEAPYDIRPTNNISGIWELKNVD